MLVGQGESDSLDLWGRVEDLLGHLVHGILNAGAFVFSESLHANGRSILKSLVELGSCLLDGLGIRELPAPSGIDISRENPVMGLTERGELVADEAVESRPRALEHAQAGDAADETDAILPGDPGLDVAGVLAVPPERVGMGFAVDGHAGPAVGDDLDVGYVDVGVLVEEVGA